MNVLLVLCGILCAFVLIAGTMGTILVTFACFLEAIDDTRTDSQRRRHHIILLICWLCTGLSIIVAIFSIIGAILVPFVIK